MDYKKIYFITVIFYLIASTLLIYPSLRISQNITSDIESLMPQSLPSIKDYSSVKNQIRNYTHLKFLIETKTPDQTELFLQAFNKKLHQKLEIDRTHFEIKEIQKYIQDYRLFYFPIEHFKKNFEKQEPIKIKSFKDVLKVFKKSLNFSGEGKKFFLINKINEYPNGYLANKEKNKYLIVIYPKKNLSINEANDFISQSKDIYSETLHQFPKIKQSFQVFGSLVELAFEGSRSQKELLSSLLFASFAIILVLLFFFKQISVVSIILFSTFIGTYLAYGFIGLGVHSININTAFLACFIIGNGINTSIYYAFYYYNTGSLSLTKHLALITFISSLCHAVCYISLAFTSFDSLYHFAYIGFLGMIFCWLTGISLFPALIYFFKIKPSSLRLLPNFPSSKKFRPILLIFLCIISLGSLFLITQKGIFQLESNLTQLRTQPNKNNNTDIIYPSNLTPTIVIISKDSVSKNLLLNKINKDKQLQDSFPFKTISFIDFLPNALNEKQKYLDFYVQNKNMAIKSAPLKKALQENTKNIPTLKDIPRQIKHHFSLKNGEFENIINISVSHSYFISHLKEAEMFINKLRQYASEVDAKIFGNQLFWIDLNKALIKTLVWSFLFCIIASLLIIIILSPNKKFNYTSLVAIIITSIIFSGTLHFFDIKVNFINFVGIPLSVSIGADYIFNLLVSKKDNIFPKEAIIAASLSTMIGYGSLLVSESNAIKSLGKITLAGEIVALSVALSIFFLIQLENNLKK